MKTKVLSLLIALSMTTALMTPVVYADDTLEVPTAVEEQDEVSTPEGALHSAIDNLFENDLSDEAQEKVLESLESDYAKTETIDSGTIVSEVLDKYAAYKNTVYKNVDYSGDAQAFLDDSVIQYEQNRRALIAEYAKEIGFTYTDANVVLSVDDITEEDGIINAVVYEWVTIHYEDKGNADVQGEGYTHKLKITSDNDGRILQDKYEDEYYTQELISEFTVNNQKILNFSGDDFNKIEDKILDKNYYTANLVDENAVSANFDYNPDAAVAYADRWVGTNIGSTSHEGFNPNYPTNYGANDCANYVSQCLFAGGIPQDDTWWANSGDSSAAWRGCESQVKYLSGRYGTRINAPSASQILKGSPVYYCKHNNTNYSCWDHTAICVGTNSSGTPVVNAHTNNRYHVYWKMYDVCCTIQINGSGSGGGSTGGDSSSAWLSLSNETVPHAVLQGNTFSIGGTITSSSNLEYVGICILDYQENKIVTAKSSPYTTSYNLKELDNSVPFGSLPSGCYTYQIEATNVQDHHFEVLYNAYFYVYNQGDADFYANIINTKAWKHTENNNNNFQIAVEGNTNSLRQVWHFVQNGDGSYNIYNCYDGRALGVDGDNIVTLDSPNVGWYMLWDGNGQMFMANNGNKVMDMTNNDSTPGTNVALWSRNNSEAQYWSTWGTDDVKPYSLDVNGLVDGNDWGNLDGVATFDIYVNDQKVGSNVNDYYNTSVLGRSTYEIQNIQPSDDYVYDGVASGSLSGTVSGNTAVKLKFTRKTNLNFDVTYDANGGSNAPAAQTKEYGKDLTLSTAAPTRKGYTFMGWATSADAGKAEYQPGDTYNGDAALTLYAVWEEVGITGYSGDTTWNLTSSGQLILSGKGAMKNYGAASQTPWNKYADQIKEIRVDNGVTRIGSFAFYGLPNLEKITMADSVTTIGDYSFKNCTKLKDAALPNNLTSIGEAAFYGCAALTSVEMPDSLTSTGTYVFKGCTGLTSVKFSSKLTRISESLFYGCTGLISVTIPEGVKTIDGYVFKNCENITEASLPSTLTKLGESAFYGNKKLTSIVIPDKVTVVGSYTFKNCVSLTSVKLPENLLTIGESAFYGCTGVRELTIPAKTTRIKSYAFKNCTNLASVTLSEKLTAIEESAFYATGLQKLTIPAGVSTIGSYAFKNCANLASVELPASLTKIQDSTFYGCAKLSALTIPDKVTEIGSYAFRKCTGLQSVSFPSSLRTIGESSFYGDTSLKNLIIPEGVTVIDGYAFKSCTNVQDIALPETLQKIGDSAFYGMDGISLIEIPANVTSVGGYAFSRCYNLSTVVFTGNAPAFGAGAFSNVRADVYYPSGNATWTTDVRQNYGGTLRWFNDTEVASVETADAGTSVE